MLGLDEPPQPAESVIRPVQKRSRGPVIGLVLVLAVALIASAWFFTNRDDKSAVENRRDDRVAQSDLRNAMATVMVAYTDTESYVVDAETLEAIEPSLTFDAVENTTDDVIGFGDMTPHHIVLVTKSGSGTYFCIAEQSENGSTFGRADSLADVDSYAECQNGWDGNTASVSSPADSVCVGITDSHGNVLDVPVDASRYGDIPNCADAGTPSTTDR